MQRFLLIGQCIASVSLYVREHNSDAALESILKVTLATTTGQHLRLQDEVLGLQVCGDLLGLLARLGHTESAKGLISIGG